MKPSLVMVENTVGLARDMRTGGIVNINKEEIQTARERKKRRKQQYWIYPLCECRIQGLRSTD